MIEFFRCWAPKASSADMKWTAVSNRMARLTTQQHLSLVSCSQSMVLTSDIGSYLLSVDGQEILRLAAMTP